MNKIAFAFAISALLTAQHAIGEECWVLTAMKGQAAFSPAYIFEADAISNPRVLCFGEKTGHVSGDDTPLFKFGSSTLVGVATNKGIELVEVYQIDRKNGKVSFTKSRIGTTTVITGFPDVVSAFTGNATRVVD